MRASDVTRPHAPRLPAARPAPRRTASATPPPRALSGASAGPPTAAVTCIAAAWRRCLAGARRGGATAATPLTLLAVVPPPSPLDAVAAGASAASAALGSNFVFMAGFYAWVCAQVLKVFTTRYKRGHWDITALMDSGGMPSSHTALSVAVTAAAGRTLGLASPLFAVSLAYALVVAYDAAGVRLHAGKQAEVLNTLLADVAREHPAAGRKLKEVLGHTPRQVAAGAVVGLLVGCGLPM